MTKMLGFAAAIAAQLLFSCGGGTEASSAPETATNADALHSGISCSGALTGVVNGNLVVRSGATCTVTGANVHGSVFVEAGALGLTASGLIISGRMDVSGAATGVFKLSGSILPGWITVTDLGSAASLQLCGNSIGGRVVLSGNRGAISVGGSGCGGNSIHDALYIQGNRGSVSAIGNFVKEDVLIAGAVAGATEIISGNSIEDNLICTSNASPPALSGNSITGTNNCGAGCAAGQTVCADAMCHDLLTSTAHCGTCANACATGDTCNSGVCTAPAPLACLAGTDLETGSSYVVCAADATSAWVSASNSGTYHATQICQTLGYTTLSAFGDRKSVV